MLETVREPIVLADEDLRVVMYSAAFTELFGVEGDAIGKPLAEVGGHAWNDEETLRRLGDVMARDRELWDFQRSLRSEEHTSELQSLMRISYAVFCLKKKTQKYIHKYKQQQQNAKRTNTTRT